MSNSATGSDDLFLVVARQGVATPGDRQAAMAELHRASGRLKRVRAGSRAMWSALRALIASWPEAVRPTADDLASIVSFRLEVPAREAAAPRGRKRAGAPDGDGDQAPPVELPGDDGPASSEAWEYRQLVAAWERFVEANEVTPDANCGWMKGLSALGGEPAEVTTDDLRERFVHTHQLRHARLKREDVTSCVSATVTEWRKTRRFVLLGRILEHPSTDAGRAELRKMIRAWTGGESDLHVAVIAHWLWQVKRRAAGHGVEWDLMPVLVGRQGSGKTTVVDKLCAVLAELSVPVTAQQIVDPKEAPIMARALIARWDEMSGASRADGDALKRAISQAQTASRRLYSNDFEVRRRCITFIGTSNFALSVILSDTSGARRFAEIPVHQVDWELWAQVDLALVWQAVSEADPAPILDHLGALRDHQRTLLPRDLMQVWLESEAYHGFGTLRIMRADADPVTVPKLDGRDLLPDETEEDRDPGGWTLAQIAQRVAFFGRGFGRGTVQIEKLGQRLREQGWTERQVRVGKRKDNRRERRWYLDADVRARLCAAPADDQGVRGAF